MIGNTRCLRVINTMKPHNIIPSEHRWNEPSVHHQRSSRNTTSCHCRHLLRHGDIFKLWSKPPWTSQGLVDFGFDGVDKSSSIPVADIDVTQLMARYRAHYEDVIDLLNMPYTYRSGRIYDAGSAGVGGCRSEREKVTWVPSLAEEKQLPASALHVVDLGLGNASYRVQPPLASPPHSHMCFCLASPHQLRPAAPERLSQKEAGHTPPIFLDLQSVLITNGMPGTKPGTKL